MARIKGISNCYEVIPTIKEDNSIKPGEIEDGKYKNISLGTIHPKLFLDVSSELKLTACSNQDCQLRFKCAKFVINFQDAMIAEIFPTITNEEGCGWFQNINPENNDGHK